MRSSNVRQIQKRDSEREIPPHPSPMERDHRGRNWGFSRNLFNAGTGKLPRAENYWNTHKDSPIVMPIQSAMPLARWEQLKRDLKISNPNTEKDSKVKHLCAKVEPHYSDLVKASQAHFILNVTCLWMNN